MDKDDWKFIIKKQDQMYPNWRKTMPRTIFTTGLCSEIGSICDQVTHLDGGGTRPMDYKKWNNKNILHDVIDSVVMLILIAEKSGFTYNDFMNGLDKVKDELESRMRNRKKIQQSNME